MAQLRTLPRPREDPGSKAVAAADDEFHNYALGMRPSATLSSKGRQGYATLSMTLDVDSTHPRTSLSSPEGFNTKWGWIPFRGPSPPTPAGERTGALPAGVVGAWKLISWGEVPTAWINGFASLDGALLALCLPDQDEAWAYARYFRATNTDPRLTACVDPHYDQTYGIQAGTSCLGQLALTGKPALQFCLLTSNHWEPEPG